MQQVDQLQQKLAAKMETVEVKEEQIMQMKKEHDASIIDAQEETVEQDQVNMQRRLRVVEIFN